ncbi:MAG TPA: hypothetical protein VK760_16535, partial [Candidatus Acidoferrales bacterium]|nr:hypothetical protein [Candidatus Acidoferrales bacterium]
LGAAFQFNSIPAIQIQSKNGFPGNQCVETRMNPTNNTWQMSPVNPGTPTAHLVKFPPITTIIQFPKNGTIYIAIACYNRH